ncbi:hypothetical protein TFLX_03088 [Thermoflexales bacterium]|nr:hypothetical protein TFLX_03088 [Thermoflexales bacterium]
MNQTAAHSGSVDRRHIVRWGLLLALAVVILYGLTLQLIINGSSDRYAEDVGEFQNVLTQWGTAHPTGYPLYALVGALVTTLLRILGMFPAAAASAFSLLIMLLALLGVYVLLLKVTLKPALAAGTALLLGVLFPYWYHAAVAEVYALLIALLVLSLFIATQWRIDREPRRLYELAFVFGLAVGHHRLAVLLAPALLIIIWSPLYAALRERPLRILGVALSLAAAFLVYLYLPLRAWMNGTWVYGQPGTWQGFWAIVAAREYGALVKPASDLSQTEIGLTTVVLTLAANLTWPVLVAGLCGLGLSLASQAWRWLALALWTLLSMNLAFAGLFSRAVFLPAALMPAMLALVIGAGLLVQWLSARWRVGTVLSGAVLAVTIFVLAYSNGPQIYALTHDRGGQAIIDNVRKAGIDRTAERPVVLALWGRDYFALAYGQQVTGEIAGIEMVDHRADVKNLIAIGHTLYVLRPTFYLRPLEWWNARLGQAYLSSAAGDLVQVSNRPVLTESDVPNNRAIAMAPGVMLRDWQVRLLDNGAWQITLYWQATAQPQQDFSVSVKATDREFIDSPDDVVAQADSNAPVYGWYSTSLWTPGEIVRDDYVVTLPSDRPLRQLEISLYTQDDTGGFINFGRQFIPLP